jgi:hypothetical protein
MTWPVSSRIGHPVAMHLEQGDDDSVSEADQAGVPLSEQADDAAAKLAGLYDGFDAYRTPTYNDYRDLLTAGLVILDTNVYLDLYRYNDQTRADMFTVLEQLGDCLWVPPQVMVEFWRNRESRLQDPRDTKRTSDDLAAQSEEAVSMVRGWANRVGLPTEQSEEMASGLSEAFEKVIVAVGELADKDARQFMRNTNMDPVLVGLEPILQGRVGLPVDKDQYEIDLAEARRRIEEKIPPGWKDAHKGGDLAAGDCLIWLQTRREAKRRGRNILIVTEDTKKDWWRLERGEIRGPLPELAQEIRQVTGNRLFMLRPQSLVLHARKIFNLEVRDESVKDIQRVADSESGGWNFETIGQFLARLSQQGRRAQEQAIRLAALRGGFVEREIVSEIGGYEEGQSLRGFTRPINRIAQEFRNQKIVSESAVDVLQTEYDSGSGLPYGWATGFRVPEVLIPLILEWQKIRHTQALRELDPTLVTTALDEFRALGHDIDDGATQDDGYGRPVWSCSSCGSSISLAGIGEQWVSPTGRAPCSHSAGSQLWFDGQALGSGHPADGRTESSTRVVARVPRDRETRLNRCLEDQANTFGIVRDVGKYMPVTRC